MGIIRLVGRRAAFSADLPRFSGFLAQFKNAPSDFWRPDHRAVFLGHAGASGLALYR